MGYPLKYLQRAGLLSTMLIGGVLGGLTAPLPSEAGTPTLTLQIDGQTLTNSNNQQIAGNSILGAKLSTCSTADQGVGYTDCYGILTSTSIAYKANNGRLYRIQNAPNATARLRVADNAGLDGLSIAGVQFVPVSTAGQVATVLTIWNNGDRNINTNEEHKLVIGMSYKFDGTRNSNNAGLQPVALRTGGEFVAGPIAPPVPPGVTYCISGTTAVACDTVGNTVEFSGVGIFTPGGQSQVLLNPSGSSTNSQTLRKTIPSADKGKPKVSFGNLPYSNLDMAMVDPQYPRFDCRTAATSTICNETLTQTMTVTLKGPDTFVATGTGDVNVAPCSANETNKLKFLVAVAKKAVAFLQWFVTTYPNNPHNPHILALIQSTNAFLLTADVPTDQTCPGKSLVLLAMLLTGLQDEIQHIANNAPPSSPSEETGTIKIMKFTSGPSGGETPDTFTFNISGPSSSTPTIPMGGANSGETALITVNTGTYSISEVPLAEWLLDGGDRIPSCNDGESTFGTTEVNVRPGSNITCTFSNTFTPGGGTFNGHQYRVISLPDASWIDARTAAKALPGGGWDLATITSPAEQTFINSLLGPAPPSNGPVHQYWIGGFQPIPADNSTNEPAADWQWINEEGPIAYQNWGTGLPPADEPNNAGSPINGVQNHVALDNRYGWGWDDNDAFLIGIVRGYVAERVSP